MSSATKLLHRKSPSSLVGRTCDRCAVVAINLSLFVACSSLLVGCSGQRYLIKRDDPANALAAQL
ncbi:MAG TPA: hypothetical protein DDW52_13785, partial [Planctomycetaceae bacterium]|nr:hypothetical protein [Planctomycetaceae bacterium]